MMKNGAMDPSQRGEVIQWEKIAKVLVFTQNISSWGFIFQLQRARFEK